MCSGIVLPVMIIWCFLPNRILCRSKRKMINSSISKPMRGTQLTYTHLWFLDLTQTWIFFYFFCWSLIFLSCHNFYLVKYFHLQIFFSPFISECFSRFHSLDHNYVSLISELLLLKTWDTKFSICNCVVLYVQYYM